MRKEGRKERRKRLKKIEPWFRKGKNKTKKRDAKKRKKALRATAENERPVKKPKFSKYSIFWFSSNFWRILIPLMHQTFW